VKPHHRFQSGGRQDPYLRARGGRSSAFNVALGKRRPADHLLQPTSAARPAADHRAAAFARRGNNFRFVVRNQGEVVNLQPYSVRRRSSALSQVDRRIQGDLIRLNRPDLGAGAALGLDNATTWRAAAQACADNEAFQQFASSGVTQMAQYACEYKTARIPTARR